MIWIAALITAVPHTIRLDAVNGELSDLHIANERKGYSGPGYVTGFVADDSHLTWNFQAAKGTYELKIRYGADGPKGFQLLVDGYGVSGMMARSGSGFACRDAGLVILRDGVNTIDFRKGWGYFDLDSVELSPGKEPASPRPIKGHLADPNATQEARALYQRLLRTYGQKTLTGQYDEKDSSFIETKTGEVPAILGGDLIDYSPSRLPYERPDDDVGHLIAGARRAQILTVSWHWNAPTGLLNDKNHRMPDGHTEDASWEKGFYTYATTFDVARALSNPDGAEYKLILRDIDAIAVQLKRLQDAHIPVLWRPLHEAEGGWFWWGAKGPEACKQLWKLLFDRLTKIHGLHNLIWVWNSPDPDWDPGSAYYDIMAIDQYPDEKRDGLSCQWQDLLTRYNGRKPLALAEFPGAPDISHMRDLGVRWLYFVSWLGDVGPRSTDPNVLLKTYRSKYVVNAPKGLK